MKRPAQWVGCALTAVIAVIALDRLCLEPFIENLRIRELEDSTKNTLEVSNPIEVRIRARQNLEMAESMRHRFGDDVAILMPLAANLRIVSRNQDAVDIYQAAFAREQRPEILRNLAEVELTLGQRDAAIEHYVLAARFSPHVIPLIMDPSVAAIVRSRAKID